MRGETQTGEGGDSNGCEGGRLKRVRGETQTGEGETQTGEGGGRRLKRVGRGGDSNG